MLLTNKVSLLRQALDEANTYEEWKEIALELDSVTGLDLWKLDNESEHYNHELIRDRLMNLRHLMRQKDDRQLMRALREGLYHDIGNIGNPLLYTYAHIGTKRLIEDYIDQVCSALNYICDVNLEFLSLEQKLRFFEDTFHSYGQPALMLSGGATLGLFHVGVCKALHERNLLPKVISGSSAGSLVTGMLGTHTDEELVRMYDGDGFYHHAWTWKRLRDGILGQGFADQRQLERFVRRNIGEYTFEEAYAKTGRHINVTVSPLQAHKARLMNELTSPYLLVWSAALASCAVPVLFPAVTLTTKNHHGEYHPYMPSEKWVDGSVRSDLPRQRLSRLFNVNYFIASQVNPHIVPFMQTDKERLQKGKITSWPKKVARAQLQMVGMGIFDFMRERTSIETIRQLMDHGYGIIGQRYYGDVTIVAKYNWRHYACMLQNPTDEMLMWFRVQGERITWPKIAMIETHARIGQTLDQCLQRLNKQRENLEQQKAANVIQLQTRSESRKRHTAQIGLLAK